jgi:hypothetical protein
LHGGPRRARVGHLDVEIGVGAMKLALIDRRTKKQADKQT